MPDKKNRSNKKSSDKNPSPDITRGRSSPEKQSGETRYEGYDEQRNSYDHSRDRDYDVDENDIDARSDEYRNYGGEQSKKNPE